MSFSLHIIQLNAKRIGHFGYGILFIFLCLLPYSGFAQIQAELYPEVILIGDTASLKITVTHDARQKIQLPQLGDSLNTYIEISNVKVDSMKRGNNVNHIQTITLTCFEPGEFLVNSLPIVISGDTLMTESKRLEVRNLDMEANIKNMYPIKPIIPQEITWWERNKKLVAYALGGILLALLLIALIWWLIKNAKKNKYVSKPLLPPYEEALENLRKLDEQKYLSQNQYNAYYTDLSFIVRRYFTRRFEFPAMALLSSDLPKVMYSKEILTQPESEEFLAFLNDADLAKYARTVPPAEKHSLYRKWVEDIIYKTRPILEEEIPEHIQGEVEEEKLRKLDKE